MSESELVELRIENSNLIAKNKLLEDELAAIKAFKNGEVFPEHKDEFADVEFKRLQHELSEANSCIKELKLKNESLSKANKELRDNLSSANTKSSDLHLEISSLYQKIKTIESDRKISRKVIDIMFEILGDKKNDVFISLLTSTENPGYSTTIGDIFKKELQKHI